MLAGGRMSNPVMEISSVSKEFSVRNRKEMFTAVNDVSVQLYEGEVFGIVGESGSGKSTLARCAFGITKPTRGSIKILGESLEGKSRKELRTLRANLGFVFQDPAGSINPRMSVFDAVAEPLILRGDSGKEIETRVGFLIERVGLSLNQLKRKAHELSGGQCQRVAIARALATNPKIVLLDEPTSSLDLSVQAQILNLLEEIRRDFNLTYLMISHNLDVIAHLSDRVAVMKDGRFVEVGDSSTVLTLPKHQFTRELISVYSKNPGFSDGLPFGFDFERWQDGPLNKWAFQNVTKFLPVQRISPSNKPVYLPVQEDENMGTRQVEIEDRKVSVHQLLKETHTDAIVVVQGGKMRFEQYFNGMKSDSPHLLQSISKSILGALYGRLIDQKIVDPNSPLSHYLPELSEGAYGKATVSQALDMTVSLFFSEDYSDPNSEMAKLDRACGWRVNQSSEGDSLRKFLPTLLSKGENGKEFQYCSANTDVLAWLISRVTGKSYPEVLEAELWKPLGSTGAATITVDSEGFSVGNGGISCTARDLALFGQLIIQDGNFNGEQILPRAWVAQTLEGALKEVLVPTYLSSTHPSGSYKNQWWITGSPSQEIYAVGIYGQYIWIDPSTQTVIVKFSSIPVPVDPTLARIHLALFRRISALF